MAEPTHVDFLACDVYPRWRGRVADAEESITIFAPYLDRMVIDLLRLSPLSWDRVTVVTDVSPESGASDYVAQLETLAALIALGVDVRSLPRLHAKVLLTDGRYITVGSQNFTRYARRSKETTAVPRNDVSGVGIINVLNDWLTASNPVEARLVEMLIKSVKTEAEAVLAADAALLGAFKDAQSKHAEAERAARERRLVALQRRSSFQLAQGTALASVTWIESTAGHDYPTLLSEDSDLTRWRVRRGDNIRLLSLDRLTMCPMLITETGRMGFARIAKTRITYIRDNVSRSKGVMIDHRPTVVTVHFPGDSLRTRNMQVLFTAVGRDDLSCRVDLLFDGEGLRVVTTAASRPGRHPADYRDYEADCVRVFTSSRRRDEFVTTLLERFTFEYLDL